MIEHDEQALVEQAKNGDTRAFERIVNQYQKVIYNLALRMTNDREDA
jgi:RNA polymerase sigma-70 factor (ECF subfamily)